MLRPFPANASAPWAERVQRMVDIVRTMSTQTDPETMVRTFAREVEYFMPSDGHVSISRRGLDAPAYRVTRSSRWEEKVNPWTQRTRLPVLRDGLLGELIYGDEPRIINDLKVADDDPGAEFISGFGSLMAIPHYHDGVGHNMAVMLRTAPDAYSTENLAECVLTHNLFGRATNNLVLSEQLRLAHQALDQELKIVGDIQAFLLPSELPDIPGMQLAAHYQTARRAGGDYYDIFALPGGLWGIFIADVSGHGTPAAVVMAAMHAIAHTYPGPVAPPEALLRYLNEKLIGRYNAGSFMFVTAFYAIYDPKERTLTYSAAGHNPPVLGRGGTHQMLDEARGLPLGIEADAEYVQTKLPLEPDDLLLFYTDGITETFDVTGHMFGTAPLQERAGAHAGSVAAVVEAILADLAAFADDDAPADDRTLLVARVR